LTISTSHTIASSHAHARATLTAALGSPRLGSARQVVLLFFLVVLFSFSLIGSQLFGSTVKEFSSIPTAFFTLCVCVAGSGYIYRPIQAQYPVLGPLFFVIFTLMHLLVITPLFLATLNDAYAVRDEQMRQ